VFQINKQNNSISFEFSSQKDLVFQTIAECRKYLVKLNSDAELIELNVILRELLMNAVRHGNKSNNKRHVRCSIELLGEKYFKIVVEDQGEGFDCNNFVMNFQDCQDPIKRSGYFLIKRFSDRIEFNDKGNCVTVYHTLTASN